MSNRPQTRSTQKKELYKLAVARSDVFSAQRTCKLILERVSGLSDQLYAPLFHAAVVAYGRPFVDNKSTGVLSRHWSDFKDQRLRETHAMLLRARHEVVAHSDSAARSMKIVPPGVKPNAAMPASKHVGFYIESYYYGQKIFVDTCDTCSDLIYRLNVRLDELVTELYEGKKLPEAMFPLTFDDRL